MDKVDYVISSHTKNGAAFKYRYHVLYHDGDRRWETMGDTTTRLTILNRAARKPGDEAPPAGSRSRRAF